LLSPFLIRPHSLQMVLWADEHILQQCSTALGVYVPQEGLQLPETANWDP
jgi:hypothetical protein